ncbi:MAG TPA: transcriptional regulator [Trebonia sp.]|nr:transcriptional regulator [Trebonia sp.]
MTAPHRPARLDSLIHPITRLSICGLLAAGPDRVEFAALRDAAGVSDSVLSNNSRVLENVDYLEVRKGSVGRRPRTWFRLTRKAVRPSGCISPGSSGPPGSNPASRNVRLRHWVSLRSWRGPGSASDAADPRRHGPPAPPPELVQQAGRAQRRGRQILAGRIATCTIRNTHGGNPAHLHPFSGSHGQRSGPCARSDLLCSPEPRQPGTPAIPQPPANGSSQPSRSALRCASRASALRLAARPLLGRLA